MTFLENTLNLIGAIKSLNQEQVIEFAKDPNNDKYYAIRKKLKTEFKPFITNLPTDREISKYNIVVTDSKIKEDLIFHIPFIRLLILVFCFQNSSDDTSKSLNLLSKILMNILDLKKPTEYEVWLSNIAFFQQYDKNRQNSMLSALILYIVANWRFEIQKRKLNDGGIGARYYDYEFIVLHLKKIYPLIRDKKRREYLIYYVLAPCLFLSSKLIDEVSKGYFKLPLEPIAFADIVHFQEKHFPPQTLRNLAKKNKEPSSRKISNFMSMLYGYTCYVTVDQITTGNQRKLKERGVNVELQFFNAAIVSQDIGSNNKFNTIQLLYLLAVIPVLYFLTDENPVYSSMVAISTRAIAQHLNNNKKPQDKITKRNITIKYLNVVEQLVENWRKNLEQFNLLTEQFLYIMHFTTKALSPNMDYKVCQFNEIYKNEKISMDADDFSTCNLLANTLQYLEKLLAAKKLLGNSSYQGILLKILLDILTILKTLNSEQQPTIKLIIKNTKTYDIYILLRQERILFT